MPRQGNQHKPCPPDEVIQGPLKAYFQLGMSDVDITDHLKDHYNTNLYGLSVITVRRLRKKWGLKSTRQQKHTMDTIFEKVRNIRQRFPTRGATSIRNNLRELHGDHVPRDLVAKLLKEVEPEQVQQRRNRRLMRRRYWAAGVNDVWPQDQHDKWGRFGLWLHASLEAFSGEINWLRIWWTNRNPILITSYFLDTCRRIGAVPVITQSDLGKENNGIANAQTIIRQHLDPTLTGTLQHRFTNHHNNILSEIKWSVFRRDFSPGFEDILEEGVHNGWYDVKDVLDNFVFRWIGIPWLQAEIDEWVRYKNRNSPRANKNKILPHGIPSLIRAKPQRYNALDFKIPVTPEIINEVEAQFAPRDHPVFELVPEPFNQRAREFYTELGEPAVSSCSLWDVYRQLRQCFHERELGNDLTTVLGLYSQGTRRLEDDGETMALLSNMKPFRNKDNVIGPKGTKYIGGLAKPPTNGLRHPFDVSQEDSESDTTPPIDPEYADFTSEDETDDE